MVPTVSQALELLVQVGVLPIEKVPKNMKLGASHERANLHSGNNLDPILVTRCDGFWDAARDVMIGNRQGGDSSLVCQPYHLRRCTASIGVGGVEMEV